MELSLSLSWDQIEIFHYAFTVGTFGDSRDARSRLRCAFSSRWRWVDGLSAFVRSKMHVPKEKKSAQHDQVDEFYAGQRANYVFTNPSAPVFAFIPFSLLAIFFLSSLLYWLVAQTFWLEFSQKCWIFLHELNLTLVLSFDFTRFPLHLLATSIAYWY